MHLVQQKRFKAKTKKRHGAALVEAAIVLPILFTIILGVVEFGRGMMVGQMTVTAARMGARRSIIDGSTNADVEEKVQEFLGNSTGVAPGDVEVEIAITPDPANTTVGNEVANAEVGDMVSVTVRVPFDKVSWINGMFLSGTKLTGSAVMRHE